jgi:deoxyhypusine synthase
MYNLLSIQQKTLFVMGNVDNNRINTFITDLLSVEKHTLKAVKKQKDTDKVKADSEAFEMLQQMEKTLAAQVNNLQQAAKKYGDESSKSLKSKLTGFLGTIAGLVDSARKDPISKMMRDNYTAVAMITAGNTMLKSTALAVDDEELQHIAGNHLKELARLTTEISRVLPLVVARELVDDRQEADRIGKMAVEKTQKAWNAENVNKGKDIV